MSRSRTLRRTGVATLAATGLLVLGAGSAAAHVTVDASDTTAGGYTLLTFSVPHGCEESPTAEVAIQVPEQINQVTPSVNPRWDVEVITEELPEPVTDAHGNEITERAAQIVYTTDDPLPSDLRDAFEVSLRLPEETAGQDLAFPVVQTCPGGEAAWVQLADDDTDADALDMPAPVVSVTAPGDGTAEATDVSAGTDGSSGTAAAAAAEGSSQSSSSQTIAVIGLAAGLLGLAMGVLALVTVRRRG